MLGGVGLLMEQFDRAPIDNIQSAPLAIRRTIHTRPISEGVALSDQWPHSLGGIANKLAIIAASCLFCWYQPLNILGE
jgi:hypothetical protein